MTFARTAFPLLLALAPQPMKAEEPVLHLTVKELAVHPFPSKGLRVTVKGLVGYKVFARERKFSGRARMQLSLENPGAAFAAYSPQDISLVGKDGIQVFPIFEMNLADDAKPMSLRLAPGARTIVEYALTGRLTFPAKVYLGETLVAEVTE